MKYADPTYRLLRGSILNFCAINIKERNFKNKHPESQKEKTTKQQPNKQNTQTNKQKSTCK